MKTIVLYDSFFGNTKTIALEIGKLLGEDILVQNVKEYKYEDFEEIDFFVIGSPTRAFRPTKDIMQVIKNMKQLKKNITVACFDTRIKINETHPFLLRKLVKYFGYAIDTMEKRLKKYKHVELLESMAFYVDDSEGPLSSNEIERVQNFVSKLK